jgi:hypothetical protein
MFREGSASLGSWNLDECCVKVKFLEEGCVFIEFWKKDACSSSVTNCGLDEICRTTGKPLLPQYPSGPFQGPTNVKEWFASCAAYLKPTTLVHRICRRNYEGVGNKWKVHVVYTKHKYCLHGLVICPLMKLSMKYVHYITIEACFEHIYFLIRCGYMSSSPDVTNTR